jgi:hypothetical protein
MELSKQKLSRKVTVRFKQTEYEKIYFSFKKTTKRKFSEYIRYVLLEKPVTVYTRDKSLDEFMAELLKLRRELSAIGNNFNQLVKRLHSTDDFQEIKLLAQNAEEERTHFLHLTAEINRHIAQLADTWLLE